MTDEEGLDSTEEQPESYSPLLTYFAPIALGILPCLLMLALLVINPDYIAQLFSGPPVGAYIPGMPIPMGWPFIFIILFMMAVAMGVNLLLARWASKHGLDLKVILVIAAFMLISIVAQSVACLFVVMGPSFIQMYKAFF